MTLEPESYSADGGTKPDRVNFDYIKGNSFRTVRPDGAIGALTPNGQVQLAFYSERQAIPQRIVYTLNDDGSLGSEIDRIGRKGVVREVEVAITLDIDTAKAVIGFLEQLVTQAAKTKDEEEPK